MVSDSEQLDLVRVQCETRGMEMAIRRVLAALEPMLQWYRSLDPNLRDWLAAGRTNGPAPMPVGTIIRPARRRRRRRR